MKRKQVFTYSAVAMALVGLAYLQFHSWKHFNLTELKQQYSRLHWTPLFAGVLLIYIDYVFRAWRWSILTKTIKSISTGRLIAAQVIGFTGLAILGRPGELVRPFLIAKQERVSIESQFAIWTLERILDLSAFFGIMLVSIGFFYKDLHSLSHFNEFVRRGLPIAGVFFLVFVLIAVILRQRGEALAIWIDKKLTPRFPIVGKIVCHKLSSYSKSLRMVRDTDTFVRASAVSILIWLVIAGCYFLVLRSYPDTSIHAFGIAEVMLLMAFSVAGGVVQLPMVGGGAQLVTISVLRGVFQVAETSSVGCGLLLWIVTFMAVIPLGLIAARLEHVSISRLAAEEEVELAEA